MNTVLVRTAPQKRCPKSSKNYIFLLFAYFSYIIADLDSIDQNVNMNIINSTGKIKNDELLEAFDTNPFTIDPRQFLTIQRFTKFKKADDKACFLFHGVGTGKTITSLSMIMYHLTEENEFILGEDEEVGEGPPDEAGTA